MYTVTESTKRNDEYFDFVKELDSIKGRRLKCSGGCEICSRGGQKLRGGAAGPPPPPEYAPIYTYIPSPFPFLCIFYIFRPFPPFEEKNEIL